jgi:hypothetical protein
VTGARTAISLRAEATACETALDWAAANAFKAEHGVVLGVRPVVT